MKEAPINKADTLDLYFRAHTISGISVG